MFRHILVPTDGSALSQKAAAAAVSLASSTGATVTAYACLPEFPLAPFSDIIVEFPSDFHERCEREARENLEWIATAAAKAGIRCQSRSSQFASPYLGIVQAAEGAGCDVILMASQGRWGLAHMLSGSETQRVLSHTRIPVLVYR